MAKRFWKTDWFIGVVVSLVMLFAGGGELLQSLERKAYDLGVGAISREPSDKIAIIAIDKQSIDNLGRWPWSRDVHAKMIDGLAAAKAKVIASTIFFAEAQVDPGLTYINKLIDLYGQAGGAPLSAGSEAIAAQAPPLGQFGPVLAEAEVKLNSDRRLGEAISKAGNVVLPMLFRLGEPRGRPDRPLPDFIKKNAITQIEKGEDIPPLLTSDVEVPLVEELGRGAAAIGHLNVNPDVDGGIRTEPLVLAHFSEVYPARLFGHQDIVDLAKWASIPVVNGLTDLLHPCQILGDMLTIMEHKNRYEGIHVAYVGDGNNICNSWINLAAKLPFKFTMAVPEGYEPDADILAYAKSAGKSEVAVYHSPQEAVRGADVIYTDVWASMGQEDESEARKRIFADYQVNDALFEHARKDAQFMHCLPAHRGDEVTDAIMDGQRSIVFDQAENRLHIQKAVLAQLMSKQ